MNATVVLPIIFAIAAGWAIVVVRLIEALDERREAEAQMRAHERKIAALRAPRSIPR